MDAGSKTTGATPRRSSRAASPGDAGFIRPLLLALCAASLMLWVRQSRHVDQFLFVARDRLWWLTLADGGLRVTTVNDWPYAKLRWLDDGSADQIPFLRGTGRMRVWRRLGIEAETFAVQMTVDGLGRPVSVAEVRPQPNGLHKSAPMACVVVHVPVWIFALVFGTYPALSLLREASRACSSRRRSDANLCRRCGYDLRATPDRCPECGALAPADGAGETARS